MIKKLNLGWLLYIAPQILGVLTYTIVVYYGKEDIIFNRLPIYQGITSFSSLMMLSLMYNPNREAIKGPSLILINLILLSFTIYFFSLENRDLSFIISFSIFSLLINTLGILKLIEGKKTDYLFFLIFNSFAAPLTLIIDVGVIYLSSFVLVLIIYEVFNKIKHLLLQFEISINGKLFIQAIAVHLPLILFPIFDTKLVQLIDFKLYSNYVVFYKYINGFIVLLFSKSQLDLLLNKEKSKTDYSNYLLLILLILFFCTLFKGKIFLIFSIFLYSIGINLISIELRKALFTDLKIIVPIFSLFSIFAYYFFLFIGNNFLLEHPYFFIFIMYLLAMIPILTSKTYKHNV
jgi:hypothetical protein